MSAKIYQFPGTKSFFLPIDVPENADKNNLPVGTVLQLNGYNDPKHVIVKNEGIDARSPHYGARYRSVNVDSYEMSTNSAFELKYIAEKRDGRIQMYILNETLPCDDVIELHQKAMDKQIARQAAEVAAKEEYDRLESIGRELFAKHIPAGAAALIVAENEIDDSDIMTDYFSTTTGGLVILGYSMHKRDVFSEMRKVAARIPETAHMKVAPKENCNGDVKTEANKSYWHPCDEHREKYSMGAGYYLKASNRYSNGWKIEKRCKWGNDWERGLYIAMAKRCIFEQQ